MNMSGRAQRMEEDVQAVIAACQADSACPFKNFQWASNHLSFDYIEENTKRHYTFNLSDDYPENTVITRSDAPVSCKVTSLRIPVVFNNLARELYTEMSISYKPDSVTIDSDNEEDEEDEDDIDEAQDTIDDLGSGVAGGAHQSVDRMLSCESGCTSDSWDDDYQDYYGQEYEEDDDNNMHSLLAQDIELVKLMNGENALSYRLFGTIDDIDVELNIDVSFLDPAIAKAWKVIREEPITVRLHLSLSRYLDATEPKVEVFQPSQKERFGIGSQLRKILESFIQENWKNVSNDLVQSSYSKDTVQNLKKTSSANPPAPKKKTVLQSISQLVRSPPRPDSSPTHPPVDDQKLAQIVEMGFSTEMARNALIITRGNFEEALNLLISSPESCIGVLADNQINIHVSAQQQESLQSTVPPLRPKTGRQNSHNRGARDKKKVVPKHTSASGQASAATGGPSGDDLTLVPTTTTSGKNAKQVPSLEHGFLMQVMKYVRQRLPTLNEFCVVCDESHVFQNGAMLKPAVCSRELCVFAFQTLGVMSDAAEDIATGAEVVDLLIEMARAACKSSRKQVILDPFPTVIDPHRPTDFAFHPDKNKDFARVEKVLDAFMSVQSMTTVASAELKKKMDKVDMLMYPLLQWIISSNRSHIVKLPAEKQISFMHTPHQFLLMSSPPAKEEAFKTAKKAHGSTFAFHGSHIENWHSIMRVGLLNASGTVRQMHGAAYGNGIYLSPHSSVSFGYSGMGYNRTGKSPQASGGTFKRFLNSKNLTCIALCEVITSKDLRKNGNIWVCPNPDHVCTRFFFVYEDGQVGDNSIDTQNEKYKREIHNAVAFQCF